MALPFEGPLPQLVTPGAGTPAPPHLLRSRLPPASGALTPCRSAFPPQPGPGQGAGRETPVPVRGLPGVVPQTACVETPPGGDGFV